MKKILNLILNFSRPEKRTFKLKSRKKEGFLVKRGDLLWRKSPPDKTLQRTCAQAANSIHHGADKYNFRGIQ